MTKLYKIGEVAELCNLTIRALRYYEELGLITPSNVDIYTGYRYYDEENIKKIKQIVLLKNLNFSLDEIKNFDENAISYKEVQLENEIKELKRKLRLVSSLKTNKGEIVMNEFVNDERVVGKWVYEATAFSKEKYLQGMTVYYSIIPEKNYYLQDDHLKMDYKKIQEIMQRNITDMTYINIFSELTTEDYYRTDTHWKQENIRKVVEKLENAKHINKRKNIWKPV